MPQGKLKVKARLPPRVAPKEKRKDPLRATRKAAPVKAKIHTIGQVSLKEGEKALREKIEKEMRSRAITEGRSTTLSTTNVKGSSLHSATSSSAAGKVASVKQVLRKLK